MSSAPQLALTGIQQNNYVLLAIVTAAGYDYALMFAKEVEYVWSQPWTLVSALFILTRYFGPFTLIVSLFGILITVRECTFLFFLTGADSVMLLRVWAMFGRSRVILGSLLVLLSVEVISFVFVIATDGDPKTSPVAAIQILGHSLCVVTATATPYSTIGLELATISQLTYVITICILVIIQSVRRSLQMFRATNEWRFNRYVGLIAKQGVLYFLALLMFQVMNVLSSLGKLPTVGWQMSLSTILKTVPMFALTPRFIISMREMYAHEVQGERGIGMDTEFGLSPLSESRTTGTAVVFADIELEARNGET